MSDEKKKLGGEVNNLDNFCQNLDSKFYSITCDNKDERYIYIVQIHPY